MKLEYNPKLKRMLFTIEDSDVGDTLELGTGLVEGIWVNLYNPGGMHETGAGNLKWWNLIDTVMNDERYKMRLPFCIPDKVEQLANEFAKIDFQDALDEV